MLTVRSANDRDDERATVDQLLRLARAFDLRRFEFTSTVVIDAMAIPHSHPVLTLRAGYPSGDALLSELLHEQLHWFFSPHLDALRRAVQEFELMYPDLPVSPPMGARNRWSSYLHLAVNALELRATEHYIGHQRARQVLTQWQFYRAIYRIVLDDLDRIEEALKRHAIDIEHVDARGL